MTEATGDEAMGPLMKAVLMPPKVGACGHGWTRPCEHVEAAVIETARLLVAWREAVGALEAHDDLDPCDSEEDACEYMINVIAAREAYMAAGEGA